MHSTGSINSRNASSDTFRRLKFLPLGRRSVTGAETIQRTDNRNSKGTCLLPLSENNASDFVDTPLLPGSELARRALVTATLGATGLLLMWLGIGLVHSGGLAGIDLWVMEALHDRLDPNNPIGPSWLEGAFRDVTALGSNTVIAVVTIAGAAFMIASGRTGPGILLATTMLGAFLLNQALKSTFARERPDFISDSVMIESSSFPSSHAMLGATLYLLLAAITAREIAEPRLRAAFFLVGAGVAAAVGFSRVYLGAHWPSDVLAGWALGAAVALAAWQMARSPRPPGMAE